MNMETINFKLTPNTAGYLTALRHLADAEEIYFSTLVNALGEDTANDVYSNETLAVFRKTREVILNALNQCIVTNMENTTNREAI